MVAEYEKMSFDDFKAQFGASGVLEYASPLQRIVQRADNVVVRRCALLRIYRNIKEIETVFTFTSAPRGMSAKQL